MRRDVPMTGFLIALFLPLLGFLIMYLLWRTPGMPMNEFLSILMKDHKKLAKVMTMALLINLIPFVYVNNRRLDYIMRGIVVATMLYAVLIVLLMFVW